MTSKVRTAIFPVGGLGTRFLPATKTMPKEMLPVVNKPLIQYAFEEAQAAGIDRFIFVTGRNKNSINNYFDHAYELERVLSEREKEEALALTRDWLPPAGKIAFVRQQKPLGLGHAVWCARELIHPDEPVAVLLADELFLCKTPLLKQMVDVYEKREGNVVAVAEVPKEQTSRYGIISPEDDDGTIVKIGGMVEKPAPEDAPSNLSIVGRYILKPEIFNYLDGQETGAGGEIQLTDAMQTMLSNSDFYGLRFEGERHDCGNKLGFLEANIAFALARPDMRENVMGLLQDFVKK